MPPRIIWTKEELILTLNLYLKIPLKKISKSNSEVKNLAEILGRTPSAIALRLANFVHVDPFHIDRGIKGMSNGFNQVKPIWDEFIKDREELIFLSEQILAQKENTTIEKKFDDILFDTKDLKGQDIIRAIKTRVNQSVFREMVLSNYNSKCAITGLDIPELLLASHIMPWSKNEEHRLNPENGICLSALYDKAFDKGLIGINTNHEIIFSDSLKKKKETEFYNIYFSSLEKQKIIVAQKYLPRKEFLECHLDTIFNKQIIL
jgi:putative restriction endonuclease